MTQHPDPNSAGTSSPPNPHRLDIREMVRTGAIFPLVVVTCIALGVLTTLGFLVHRVISNHGLMPPPSVLRAYDCSGFATPFQLEFRHGLDVIRLKTTAYTLEGSVINDHVVWANSPAAVAALGFEPPTEIVYDDASSIRMLGADRAERLCKLQR